MPTANPNANPNSNRAAQAKAKVLPGSHLVQEIVGASPNPNPNNKPKPPVQTTSKEAGSKAETETERVDDSDHPNNTGSDSSSNNNLNRLLTQEFCAGSFQYRGLVLKHYYYRDPRLDRNIARAAASDDEANSSHPSYSSYPSRKDKDRDKDVGKTKGKGAERKVVPTLTLPPATRLQPIGVTTPQLIERLTGLLLQVGVLTLAGFIHHLALSTSTSTLSSASSPPPQPFRWFGPGCGFGKGPGTSKSKSKSNGRSQGQAKDEGEGEDKLVLEGDEALESALMYLLKLEALSLSQIKHQLLALSHAEWHSYLALHRVRNQLLSQCLLDQPGLIGDTTVRLWYVIRLWYTLPTYLTQVQQIRNGWLSPFS